MLQIKLFVGQVTSESATGSTTSNRVRTTLTVNVEDIYFDTQVCHLAFHNYQFFPLILLSSVADVYPGSESFHPGSRLKKTPDPDPLQRI